MQCHDITLAASPFFFSLVSVVREARDFEVHEFYSSGFNIKEIRPEIVRLRVQVKGKIMVASSHTMSTGIP